MRTLNLSKLDEILKNGTKEELNEFCSANNLKIVDNKILPVDKDACKDAIGYWDKKQHVRKLQLNGLYGTLLNSGCRFFDQRLGQSTTLSGRQVVKHMTAKVNELITGKYDYLGESIIYNDTDSVYFSAYPAMKPHIESGDIPWDKDTVVKVYDQLGELVNDSFPDFMYKAFHCPQDRGALIKSGREIVATKALFITKKRYAALCYDIEGKRLDIEDKPGKVKAMGLDLKRADTPEFMQDFLSEILEKVLTGVDQNIILDRITEFRKEFKTRPGWEKGTPKRVNNLGKFEKLENDKGKANLPGHVRASLNWNVLKKLNRDKYAMSIMDGFKVIVCKLKPNPMGYTSVAYPIDELRLPDWFKELPFDHEAMEDAIIDAKLDNLIGILNWDVDSTKRNNTFNDLFEF